jgi:hypothetical protein
MTDFQSLSFLKIHKDKTSQLDNSQCVYEVGTGFGFYSMDNRNIFVYLFLYYLIMLSVSQMYMALIVHTRKY